MPISQQEIYSTKKKFLNLARFPRVIGAIDCTHIKNNFTRFLFIGDNSAENFRNRKRYFSLNVQVVGDSDLWIRDIVCRGPGSTHDQTY
ncbi:hypothetical protein NQ317_005146 [Molorchus minor]|uniref:DDE Tnp4 domain-containing protein n=1 Tax=Molorchus minor TaxID=1323400 RepID=A0ABQ9ITI1_9CUCU|nr:hypothetical protein NQ317_005146 [Molorchus minor]